jgi:hypothetical protein
MPRTGWTPSIVPKGDDQSVYIVLDDFGRNGRDYRETDVERADVEAVIVDMLEGEYKNPVRVIGFNTAEKWSQDVSADVVRTNYAVAAIGKCVSSMKPTPRLECPKASKPRSTKTAHAIELVG